MTAALLLLMAASLASARWEGSHRWIVVAAALLAAVHVGRWMRGAELRWSRWIAAPAMWAVWGAMQVALGITLDPVATRTASADWAGAAIVFFLTLQVRKEVPPWIAAFAVVFAGFSITVYRMDTGSDPAFGPFWNRNHYAAWVEMVLPVVLSRLIAVGHSAYGVASLGLVISVLLTRSRLGIALVVAEIAILMLLSVRKKAVTFAVMGVAATVGLAAGWNRFAQLGDFRAYEARLESWRATAGMAAERPLAGWGLGAWQDAYPRFAPDDIGFTVLHADNDWLEWTAEAGAILPLVTLLPLLLAGVRGVRSRPETIGLAAVALHALGEFPLHKPALLDWWMALLALSISEPSARPDDEAWELREQDRRTASSMGRSG